VVLGLIVLLQAIVVAVSGPPDSPEYLPIRVAEAYGLFAREELHVTLRSTRAEPGAAEALAQGQADLAATSFEALVRFGHRTPAPRLVFALTAAPPVTLLVGDARRELTAVTGLVGEKVGLSAPGTPEQTWLQALLARQDVRPADVELVSLGTRGVVSALEAGEVAAAFVTEPAATALVRDGRARVLVDLTSPAAVSGALGGPTVNAAVFARGDRRPSDAVLTAFARAVLAAERLIVSSAPDALKEPLSRAVVGNDAEFARRVEATRDIYVPGGLIPPEAVAHTLEAMKLHLPLPRTLKLPQPADMLHLGPARRAGSGGAGGSAAPARPEPSRREGSDPAVR
jgi:NitT/TauT family transport system substrate-binding protein